MEEELLPTELLPPFIMPKELPKFATLVGEYMRENVRPGMNPWHIRNLFRLAVFNAKATLAQEKAYRLEALKSGRRIIWER